MKTKRRFENTDKIDPKLVEIVQMLGDGEVLPDVFQALDYYLTTNPISDISALHFIVDGIGPFLERLNIECHDHAPDRLKIQFKTNDLFLSAIPEPVYILKIITLLLKYTSLPCDLFTEYFGQCLIPDLISLLRFHDERTRILAFGILQKIAGRYKDLHDIFLEASANEFTSLFINNNSSIGLPNENRDDNRNIEWVAKLVLLLDSDVFVRQAELYYSQYILPAIIFSPPSFSLVILIFCRDFPLCQIHTLRHFYKVYQKGPTAFQGWIIDMTGKIIEIHLTTPGASSIEHYVSLLLNRALSSESFIVVDTVLNLFLYTPVQRYLMNELAVILPKCFNCLYKLSKKFWRQEQRMKALDIVDKIVRFNHDVFEACLVEYNKQKLSEPENHAPPNQNLKN